ncbi:carbon-nitrogen hydrolase family protein [Shewanella salipaludis]|uniref:Carbon-nitrogen hydrolase family protein n=1 Tax=Shewanella salipaludis TaxID=2723052 RepID=A0A972G4E0_9GAMM|nr:carbon-nitrogen hydrolase family protein [Shewanella salipaludis]NMH67019.1 carbon-nitrogen hydrolase family protein [Shewanella salipaludis]
MKTDVTISLAQIPVVKGDLRVNLEHHLKMIEQSSRYNADVVVFPELSLTGYELDLAAKLAVSPEPSYFKELSQASIDNDIIVIAGCPLKSFKSSKPTIGAVICFPDGTVQFYSKQYLHAGEETYCSFGSTDYFFKVKGHQIALAICADFTESAHSRQARELGADIYVVSALISDNGFVPDAKMLSEIASEHGFPVLLSNHISVTGGWTTCGKNSIWNSGGKLVFSSDSKDSCLVLCTLAGNEIEATKT